MKVMNKRRFETDWTKKADLIKNDGKGPKKEKVIDTRLYSPKFQEDGTAYAVVRLLPSIDTDIDWVTMYRHSLRKDGMFYINNCRTTLGEKGCLSCQKYFDLWDKTPGADNTQANLYKRKSNYYVNILVLEDPATPENVGKVFVLKFNYELYNLILSKITPKNSNIKPLYVFDYYEGANLNLVLSMKKVSNYETIDYKDCSFDGKSAIGSDDEIEAIRNKCFPLKEFIAPKEFLDATALEEKFLKLDSGNAVQKTPALSGPKANLEDPKQEAVKESSKSVVDEEPESFDAGDDEAFFDKLKQE